MAGHGAGPGPAQPAGRRLVAEHDGGHPPGAPPLQRHDGSEDADHRGADRGREVGGAGVPDDDGGRAGEDPGELSRRLMEEIRARAPIALPGRKRTAAKLAAKAAAAEPPA